LAFNVGFNMIGINCINKVGMGMANMWNMTLNNMII
jgi:hypothetical protein